MARDAANEEKGIAFTNGGLHDFPELASDDHDARVHIQGNKLARRLSARQVQMIAIGGTIGTGLFLGTGKSLATGGPGSILIAYSIVGAIVFVTMLSLGEMAAFVPVAGSFCTYAGRFVDDALGFALTWNYWFNDAVSTAADIIALQLLLEFWTDNFPGWAISLIFLVVVIGLNLCAVRVYGEVEYWLSLLKVITIVIFIIVGIAVNCGANTEHRYIGGHNWLIGDAPFVSGIGGFASVFVTASFAYGGTESIAVTAGETQNPSKTLPKVVRNVFWRILLFYILSVLIIGLDVPYNTPNLSEKNTKTSPFTIVFTQVGSDVAGSFINAVIVTSVISAANHALFAGTRLMYTLAVDGYGPKFLGTLNRQQVPWVAVLVTSSISGLCFGASYIGAGQLWTWLQNIVGVVSPEYPCTGQTGEPVDLCQGWKIYPYLYLPILPLNIGTNCAVVSYTQSPAHIILRIALLHRFSKRRHSPPNTPQISLHLPQYMFSRY